MEGGVDALRAEEQRHVVRGRYGARAGLPRADDAETRRAGNCAVGGTAQDERVVEAHLLQEDQLRGHVRIARGGREQIQRGLVEGAIHRQPLVTAEAEFLRRPRHIGEILVIGQQFGQGLLNRRPRGRGLPGDVDFGGSLGHRHKSGAQQGHQGRETLCFHTSKHALFSILSVLVHAPFTHRRSSD